MKYHAVAVLLYIPAENEKGPNHEAISSALCKAFPAPVLPFIAEDFDDTIMEVPEGHDALAYISFACKPNSLFEIQS